MPETLTEKLDRLLSEHFILHGKSPDTLHLTEEEFAQLGQREPTFRGIFIRVRRNPVKVE